MQEYTECIRCKHKMNLMTLSFINIKFLSKLLELYLTLIQVFIKRNRIIIYTFGKNFVLKIG